MLSSVAVALLLDNPVLHTQKTGAQIRLLLPEYAVDIISKYRKFSRKYILPRFSSSRINKYIKILMLKAGWDYPLPKIRHRKGETIEIYNNLGNSYRFCDHITAHTMRRTAITNARPGQADLKSDLARNGDAHGPAGGLRDLSRS